MNSEPFPTSMSDVNWSIDKLPPGPRQYTGVCITSDPFEEEEEGTECFPTPLASSVHRAQCGPAARRSAQFLTPRWLWPFVIWMVWEGGTEKRTKSFTFRLLECAVNRRADVCLGSKGNPMQNHQSSLSNRKLHTSGLWLSISKIPP